MVGIIVFTNEEILNHKKTDGLKEIGCYCFWKMRKIPKKKIDKIYFAIKGQIKGYFKVFQTIKYEKYLELRFHSESWKSIRNGKKLKPSQGWRYYKNDKSS